MIVVKNISRTFGAHKAVDNISFTVEKGENIVFLGTSGSGKTTLLKMINRLLEPDSGEILIDGRSIRSQRAEDLRRGIGYVFQNNGLFPHYTIEENIGIVPRLLGWERDRIAQRVTLLMEKLRLSPAQYRGAYPNELSGGQQQRVGIARALAAGAPILLMDEPFGALDPITRASVKRDFKELDELRSKTTVLVTHDIQEAFELADRIFLMDGGKVIQEGTAEDLFERPVNQYVIDFFEGQRYIYDHFKNSKS
ncbi:ABC transporter ATP-binding protein [Puia sp.]|jgi:osmoprotectant transport system ATP-binding protein|uniref:ABC transporter ATP-binding protein n=1 Tax=Puia sp. TaxID=2045100 RepID=UPI002F424169